MRKAKKRQARETYGESRSPMRAIFQKIPKRLLYQECHNESPNRILGEKNNIPTPVTLHQRRGLGMEVRARANEEENH